MDAEATVVTFESVYEQAEQLSRADKLRLIARIAETMSAQADEKRRVTKAELQQEYAVKQAALLEQKLNTPKRNVRGILADLGPAPSEQDIAEAREEMMRNFPREDIA